MPLLSIASTYWWRPEIVALVVVSFASVGHHLPGFLRAYGEADLFRRFWLRFVLAPPLLFAFAWASFSRGLHGLELIVLVWATWHALMQTYGFCRIYDRKLGVSDEYTARLDLAVCGMIFAVGVVFSDARVMSFAETFWRIGLPIIDAVWLERARWFVGAIALIVAAMFVKNQLRLGYSGANGKKIALLVSTASLYWLTGRLTQNTIIGVAMFEVFHALQYYAIVWAYQRGRAVRLSHNWRRGLLLLTAYVAAIAAFGSLRWFTDGVGSMQTQQLLFAVFGASAILHFYYDGFIWKLRDQRSHKQLGLATSADSSSATPRIPIAWKHAAAWGAAVVLLAGLTWLEMQQVPLAREDAIVTGLASWTPDVPELQRRISRRARQKGDLLTAITAAQKAVKHRPRSFQGHVDLGLAYLEGGKAEQAAQSLATACMLAPDMWENYCDYAQALVKCERFQEAETALTTAADLNADQQTLNAAWVNLSLAMMNGGDKQGSLRLVEDAAQTSPKSAPLQLQLGRSLRAVGRKAEGLAAMQNALVLRPDWAEANFQMGLANLKDGQIEPALTAINRALKQRPKHALSHFHQGNAYFALARYADAESAFRRCIELKPGYAPAHNNLGSSLLEQDDNVGAEQSYRRAIELNPDYADSHYNLGLVLYYAEQDSEARLHFRRAAALGRKTEPEVARELGMK